MSFNDIYQRQTRIAQEWLQINCPEFMRNDQRSANSPDTRLPNLGCDVGDLSQAHPKPKSITELKEVL